MSECVVGAAGAGREAFGQCLVTRPIVGRRHPRRIPAVAPQVSAWILWEDGVEELVPGHAVAWNTRAVRVRFGAPPQQDEVWVWAGAVERA